MRKAGTILIAMGMIAVGSGFAAADVGFRPATTNPVEGFKLRTAADGSYYVGSQVLFTDADVLGMETLRSGTALDLALSPNAAAELAAGTRAVDRIAVLVNSEMLAAPQFQILANGHVLLSGLSANASDVIANELGQSAVDPNAPALFVQAEKTSVAPGDVFTVHAFVSGVADLNVYQIRVTATGTVSGLLDAADLQIDKARPDYIFGQAQVIDAVDFNQDRMGSLRMNGGTSGNGYLGTYVFAAPAGVTQRINVNVEIGQQSFLTDSAAQPIAFRVGAPVVVNAGTPASLGGRQPVRTSK